MSVGPSANIMALPSAVAMRLGKQGVCFAECHYVAALAKASVTVTCPSSFFFTESQLSTWQNFLPNAQKIHSANSSLPIHWLSCHVCRGWHSANPLPSVFRALRGPNTP